MSDLQVIYDNNGSFEDYSRIAKDYLRDDFSIAFSSATDKLYIGLYKPFNTFYVEITQTDSLGNLSFATNGNSLEVIDDTNNFSRNGFITFDKPENWALSSVDGQEAYWLEISSSSDYTADFRGINIVFSDDNDLQQEVRNIDRLRYTGDTSFIAYHVASRNEIIQTLRNGGYSKKVDDLLQNITKWDVLDFGEIRQASKYLTLSKIYFDISENPDDKFERKSKDFDGKFGQAFQLYYMKLDKNDDGKYEQQEDLVLNNIEIELT